MLQWGPYVGGCRVKGKEVRYDPNRRYHWELSEAEKQAVLAARPALLEAYGFPEDKKKLLGLA